ncbi:MAG: DUF3662 domain-containing protein [Ilumatobacteraceae bacterium]|nr:DUF3662 domain-containing protein [Ilumatobacteraceae bacterium]
MLTRTRRNGIRPIEIGREVIALMDEQAQSGVNQIGHRYTIGLHKNDLAALSDAIKPLMSELRQAIDNHAKFERYSLSGEAEVVLVEDVAVQVGSCAVAVAKPTATERPAPQSIPPAHQYSVLMADGSRHILEGDLVTVGRQASCAIVIADSNISRVHARFRAGDNGWTIEDLSSTNGTKVNGVLITEPTPLSHGQLIALGSLQLQFEQA